MSQLTHLDELVDYPASVIEKISAQQNVRDLLVNKSGATLEDLKNSSGKWSCIFDYDFVPGVENEPSSVVCVDLDVINADGNIKSLDLYVSVICAKSIIELDPLVFGGYFGNRINNLIRYIDLSLRQSKDFGIGKLELKHAKTVAAASSDFCKKTLAYRVANFNLSRRM